MTTSIGIDLRTDREYVAGSFRAWLLHSMRGVISDSVLSIMLIFSLLPRRWVSEQAKVSINLFEAPLLH